MVTRLHQILSLEKSVKGITEGEVTRAYHDAKRVALFNGLSRVYKPRDADDRDVLPPEKKIVQLTAAEVLGRAIGAWVRRSDIIATKDLANQIARADIVIDGNTLMAQVPATTLLYFEKMLVDVRELVSKLPVLDPEVDWGVSPDHATGLWRSQPEETFRSKKVPKAFVKSAATDKFPAQVDTFTEDIVIGTWERTLMSGALPAPVKADMLARVDELADAVKLAREHANTVDAPQVRVAQALFDHLLGA